MTKQLASCWILCLSTCVIVLPGSLVGLSAIAEEADLAAKPSAAVPLTFEAVYEESRFFNKIEDAMKTVDQYLAKNKSTEAAALKAKLKMEKAWLNFEDKTARQHISIDQLADFAESLRPLYAEVTAAVDRVPDSAIAQEFKGEAGNVMFGSLIKLAVAKAQAGQDYGAVLEQTKRVGEEATAAFERSLAIDDSRAQPHVSLAFELSGSTGGMTDPRIMEHALVALEKSPSDPAPVVLIVDILRKTGRSLKSDVQSRVEAALRGTTGRCREQLLETQKELHTIVHQAESTSLAMAAVGFSEGLGEDIYEMQDALEIIDAALPRKR